MANKYYSTPEEMLIGDVNVAGTDPERFVAAAFKEMNSRLGYVYELPIELDDTDPGALVLNKINNLLASGRFLQSQATGSEDGHVHSYGASLVRQAYAELDLVLSGQLPLNGATRVDGESDDRPSITNRDDVSPVEAFEDYFFGNGCTLLPERLPGDSAVWAPGS